METTRTYCIEGCNYTVMDSDRLKEVRSENYNYNFVKKSGRFERWGKTFNDDPLFAPAPEILDIEVTTICNGVPNCSGVKSPCSFCYKSNTPNGKNMSFDTFQKILDRFPTSFLTQIAFGADSECTSNPDIFEMMMYARCKGIVTNITVANVSNDIARKLDRHCGAVAISRYDNKDVCYDSVQKLTSLGMKQINIHQLVCEETFDKCKETLNDILIDNRLKKLNAIVLLSLKKKGRGEKYTPLSNDKFKSLIDFCLEKEINFGMDSCSASKFLNVVKGHELYNDFFVRSESCESSNFSSFIDVDGKFYPCSFASGNCGKYGDWKDGIDVTQDNFDFSKDLWFSDKVKQWRAYLLNNVDSATGCRKCPIFNV